jgi:hypothetical protein
LCIVPRLRRRIAQCRDELWGNRRETSLVYTGSVNRRREGDDRRYYRYAMEYVAHEDPPFRTRLQDNEYSAEEDNRLMPSHELSIVIPVLNDTEPLQRLLTTIPVDPQIDIVIVNGGVPDDRLTAICDRPDVRLLTSAPGRGRQMNVGASPLRRAGGSYSCMRTRGYRHSGPTKFGGLVPIRTWLAAASDFDSIPRHGRPG